MFSKCGVPLALSLLAISSGVIEASLTAEQVQRLRPSTLNGIGNGQSVLDGDTVVIGVDGDDDNGEAAGAAYVFTRSDGVWTEQAKLRAHDGAEGDNLGRAVAVHGGTILVGSPFDDDSGPSSGSAYVFVGSGNQWTQEFKLVANEAARFDFFGDALDVHGDTALVGAIGVDGGSSSFTGAAFVFTRSEGTWTQAAKLEAGDVSRGSFGSAVALDGDTALVGAPTKDLFFNNAGAAYVFVRSGESWVQQARLLADDPASGARFGEDVDIHGDTAVIGARGGRGAAYVFVRTEDAWTLQAKLSDAGGSGLGHKVAISGDTVLVSSHVFTRSGDQWTRQSQLVPADGPVFNFGSSTDLDMETAVVGVAGLDLSAYVFRLVFDPVDLLKELMDKVQGLDLHPGIENALTAKLMTARLLLEDLSAPKNRTAGNVLGAFIHQVEAQRGKKITEADAGDLISDAGRIIDLLISQP
ncbi:MAG: FG-GAP repeat protein [Planctomycetota bacterium]|jgi:hypothetical protein